MYLSKVTLRSSPKSSMLRTSSISCLSFSKTLVAKIRRVKFCIQTFTVRRRKCRDEAWFSDGAWGAEISACSWSRPRFPRARWTLVGSMLGTQVATAPPCGSGRAFGGWDEECDTLGSYTNFCNTLSKVSHRFLTGGYIFLLNQIFLTDKINIFF